MLRQIASDRFIQLLLAVSLLANLLPVSGNAATIAGWITIVGIFALFFLNGVRIPRDEVLHGMRNWRLMAAVGFWVFGAMPLAGWAASHLAAGWIPPAAALGLLFVGVLPTTVQSATAYCSLAKGNVAASIVAVAVMNLAGVFVTPLLFAGLGSTSGVVITGDAVVRIATLLLLPFLLGQFAQRWLGDLVRAHRGAATMLDRAVIALAVYTGFSAAVTNGIWGALSGGELAVLSAFIVALLVFSFGGVWTLGGLLRLPRTDRTTLLFAGAHKSLTVGAPLSALLFQGYEAGLLLLALLIYHFLQMLASAVFAAQLAATAITATNPPAASVME